MPDLTTRRQGVETIDPHNMYRSHEEGDGVDEEDRTVLNLSIPLRDYNRSSPARWRKSQFGSTVCCPVALVLVIVVMVLSIKLATHVCPTGYAKFDELQYTKTAQLSPFLAVS